MNRKQLTFLIVLGVVLGGLGWLAWQKDKQPYQDSTAKMGAKLIPDFPLGEEIQQIVIKQPKAELTLAKQDVWTVKERGNYPANFDNIHDLLTKCADLKVAMPRQVGASRLPMLDLVPPDKGNGTLVEFKDKSGKVLKSLLLGVTSKKDSGSDSPMGGGSFPNGRYVMVGGDVATVAIVTDRSGGGDPFSSAEAKPAEWLNKTWFKVEHHKTVSVVTTNATNNWTLSRETETGDWKLADLKPGEELDRNKTGAMTGSFSYPSFNDLATNSEPSVTGLDKPPVTATIENFEGFTYTAKVGNKVGEDAYYFQIAVAGNFPKERTPGKDEKPEDKTKLDTEFKDALKKKEEKLKADQAYSKWTYVIGKWTVDPFLKERKDLLAEKKEEAKPEGAAPTPTPLPATPVTLPGPLTPPPLPEKK